MSLENLREVEMWRNASRPIFSGITVDQSVVKYPEQGVGTLPGGFFHFSVVDIRSHLALLGIDPRLAAKRAVSTRRLGNSYMPHGFELTCGDVRPTISLVFSKEMYCLLPTLLQVDKAFTYAQSFEVILEEGKDAKILQTMRDMALYLESTYENRGAKTHERDIETNINERELIISDWNSRLSGYSSFLMCDFFRENNIPAIFSCKQTGDAKPTYSTTPRFFFDYSFSGYVKWTRPAGKKNAAINNIQLSHFLQTGEPLFSEVEIEEFVEQINKQRTTLQQ